MFDTLAGVTRRLSLLIALGSIVAAPAAYTQNADNALAGRWDLTIKTAKATYPSWIEVSGTADSPQVRIVGRSGSVHPAEDVKREGQKLTFSSPVGKNERLEWEVIASGNKLTGTQKHSNGVTAQIAGLRAPALDRKEPAAWSDPEPLFNGKDLSGWIPDNPAKNHWKVEDGVLVNEAAGANIRTKRQFNDFKLHIEYNCPQDGNSGVYLRGRYEVQVEYEPAGTDDKYHSMGSIYGFIAPAVDVSPRPGQWESYDVTLVGRTVTVIRDGQLIIDHKEIPGITGGALNSHEGEPGPIYLQGDHTGGMKYRNITISVPKR